MNIYIAVFGTGLLGYGATKSVELHSVERKSAVAEAQERFGNHLQKVVVDCGEFGSQTIWRKEKS